MAARRKKTAAPDAPQPKHASPTGTEAALPSLREEIARLRECAELLAGALQDVPKADDFQPLADHLYEFAQTTPRLLESLRGVPEAVGPLEDAVRALEEVLITLPRAEDYEPLVGPLREFARVAPALAEQLALVMKNVAPLGEAVKELRKTAEAFRPAAATISGDGAQRALDAAAQRMSEAQRSIREALGSLPRDPEYHRVAEELRAIASVSPSLMEWLNQVPKLSMPLGASIASLERAADLLAEGESELRHLAAGSPRGKPGRRDGERGQKPTRR